MPDGTTSPPVFDPRDPMPIARTLIASQYTRQYISKSVPIIHHHRGSFHVWNGAAYAEIDDAAMRAKVWAMLEDAQHKGTRGKRAPFKPSTAIVSNVVDALRGATYLDRTHEPPCWLDDSGIDRDPVNTIALTNGLIDVETRTLTPHSPAYFNLNALGFAYAPDASTPVEWLKFLHSVWRDDPERISTLQEMFGYLLTPDTSQQKIPMLEGPPRSGKGTIGRVLAALVGHANVCSPTLNSLGSQFGLAPLIGKGLAILSDARIGGRTDQAAIAERLLSISGEDAQTIDRKHKEAWSGTLKTRFMILTNELPKISDASGALPNRFIILSMRESFLGREDHGLTGRLLCELPGIFGWSLDGLARLRKRGHFQPPSSSKETIQVLNDLASPVRAFVRECCTIDPDRLVECTTFYNAYRTWCAEHGRDHPGTEHIFGRDLRAAFPILERKQRRVYGEPKWHYLGIDLGAPVTDCHQ